MLKILCGLLAADAVMALKHEQGIRIHSEQRVMVGLIEEAGAFDVCDRAFFFSADVDEFTR